MTRIACLFTILVPCLALAEGGGPAVGRVSAADRWSRDERAAAARTLNGAVLDAGTGRPLPSAIVVLHHEGWREPLGLLADADGRYEFADLAPGAYEISVESAGHACLLDLPLTVAEEGDDLSADLLLPPGGPLEGRVTPAGAGDGLAGVHVMVAGGDPVIAALGLLGWETWTDADGRFRLEGLPAGVTVELFLHVPGFKPRRIGLAAAGRDVRVELDRAADGEEEALVELWAFGAMRGVAFLGDRPLAGAVVRATPAELGIEAVTGSQGRFFLDGLPEGRCEVSILHAGARGVVFAAAKTLVDRARIAAVRFELPDAAGWRGCLRAGGEPVSGATVEAVRYEGDDRLVGAIGSTDDTGAFHLPFLAPGRYRVRVERTGREDARLELELPGEGTLDINLE